MILDLPEFQPTGEVFAIPPGCPAPPRMPSCTIHMPSPDFSGWYRLAFRRWGRNILPPAGLPSHLLNRPQTPAEEMPHPPVPALQVKPWPMRPRLRELFHFAVQLWPAPKAAHRVDMKVPGVAPRHSFWRVDSPCAANWLFQPFFGLDRIPMNQTRRIPGKDNSRPEPQCSRPIRQLPKRAKTAFPSKLPKFSPIRETVSQKSRIVSHDLRDVQTRLSTTIR